MGKRLKCDCQKSHLLTFFQFSGLNNAIWPHFVNRNKLISPGCQVHLNRFSIASYFQLYSCARMDSNLNVNIQQKKIFFRELLHLLNLNAVMAGL